MKSEALKRNKSYTYSIALVSVLILIMLAVGWYFAFKTSAVVAKLKTESLYLNEESDKKTEIVQKYNRVSDYHSTVNEAIPESKEISSFIADVEALANKSNLNINSSMIGAASKTKNSNPSFSQTLNQKDYYELQIKYEVEGSYQNFLTFLNDLENLRRLNNVSGLRINKISTTPNTDTVTVNFVDSIYIKK